MSADLEQAAERAQEFLQAYLLEHAFRGVGRFISCQHAAADHEAGKVQVAFAVEPPWLKGDEEVDAAIQEVVDALLAAQPHLQRFGVTWYQFQG